MRNNNARHQLTSNFSSQAPSIFFSMTFFCFAVSAALKFAGTSHLNLLVFADLVFFLAALNFALARRVSSSSSITGL